MNEKFTIIVAVIKDNNGIGKISTIPWSKTPEGKYDLKMFRQITMNTDGLPNVVIMGRKTYESIPVKYRPLPGRLNCVISTTMQTTDDIRVYSSFEMCLNHLYLKHNYNKIFVIGGGKIYAEAINRKDCECIYLTELDLDYPDCDTFFPVIPNFYKVKSRESVENLKLNFLTYENISDPDSDECEYLHLISEILKYPLRSNRTSIKTRSVFGRQLKFSIRDGIFPLLTTKKMFYRGIIEELLFFIRGDHDNRKLQSKNVHIWDGNTNRDYLDKYNKQHIQTNDLGLAYGVQWRAAGAPLKDIDTDYKGSGVDQLRNTIDLLKNDPSSRRIIINSWNVQCLDDMALVPCHILYQFYVDFEHNELSCMMTQRSADTFLGLPFNIASTALLTHIIAKTCDFNPGEIIINTGDTHIYENHIEQAKIQLNRSPYKFPKLEINKNLNDVSDMESLQFEDFKIINYNSYPGLKASMVV